MITAMISRLMILAFGTLYPAYASYKAVRTKDVKEYVKWMMYWIVFALFTCAETFTDVFFSFWFPFYYEIKVALVFWLLSPATKGSSFLYRNFVHPALQRRESIKNTSLETVGADNQPSSQEFLETLEKSDNSSQKVNHSLGDDDDLVMKRENESVLSTSAYVAPVKTKNSSTNIDLLNSSICRNCRHDSSESLQHHSLKNEFNLFSEQVSAQLKLLPLEEALVLQEKMYSMLIEARLRSIRNSCS